MVLDGASQIFKLNVYNKREFCYMRKREASSILFSYRLVIKYYVLVEINILSLYFYKFGEWTEYIKLINNLII